MRVFKSNVFKSREHGTAHKREIAVSLRAEHVFYLVLFCSVHPELRQQQERPPKYHVRPHSVESQLPNSSDAPTPLPPDI